MSDKNTSGIDLEKLAAIADRVDARGLFNASCDIRDWIQEVHTTLARRARQAAPEAPTQQAEATVSPIRGFDRSLASTDAYDPQSFIDGVKWAEEKLLASPAATTASASIDGNYETKLEQQVGVLQRENDDLRTLLNTERARYFTEHGVLHDRVTGQHLWTQDQYDEQWRDMYKAGLEDAANGFNMLTGKVVTPAVSAQNTATIRNQGDTDAARDVLAERRRQVESEGWLPDLDDTYENSDMARAAACYALHDKFSPDGMLLWPWPLEWWKPSNERRNLVKAGALILAEIERIDRAAIATSEQKGPQA